MKILIIDNYDSFTYNLYQLVGEILKATEDNFVVDVFRNDQLTVDQIQKRKYNRIIISPGPGESSDKAYFGVCADVLLKVGQNIPVLGVCLGMQGMAHYFGGKVVRAKKPMHGKTSLVTHDGKGIFRTIPQHIEVMRYHSLVADKESLPKSLLITATSQDSGEIMGLRHKEFLIEGIQFHPESFATEAGNIILTNFLFREKI